MSISYEYLAAWLRARCPDGDDDTGASLVEYALLVALIFAVCVIAVGILGEETKSSFESTGQGFAAN